MSKLYYHITEVANTASIQCYGLMINTNKEGIDKSTGGYRKEDYGGQVIFLTSDIAWYKWRWFQGPVMTKYRNVNDYNVIILDLPSSIEIKPQLYNFSEEFLNKKIYPPVQDYWCSYISLKSISPKYIIDVKTLSEIKTKYNGQYE